MWTLWALGLGPTGGVLTLPVHLLTGLGSPVSWRAASCLAAVKQLWSEQTREPVSHLVGYSEV